MYKLSAFLRLLLDIPTIIVVAVAESCMTVLATIVGWFFKDDRFKGMWFNGTKSLLRKMHNDYKDMMA